MVEVRVLSYNVRSLRDDQQALAAVIRSVDPDVVCVQEAPRFFRWRSKAAALARTSGMYVVTGGRPAAAMLLLASLRTQVVRTRNVKFPWLWRRRLHRRGLAMAVLEVAGARFGVASMHLSLDAAERRQQAEYVLQHLASLDTPHVVLGGDVNERPPDPTWRRFVGALQDGWAVAPWGGEHTSPANGPVQRIDAVFASAEIRVLRCGVPDAPAARFASDHLPVLAVLDIPAS